MPRFAAGNKKWPVAQPCWGLFGREYVAFIPDYNNWLVLCQFQDFRCGFIRLGCHNHPVCRVPRHQAGEGLHQHLPKFPCFFASPYFPTVSALLCERKPAVSHSLIGIPSICIHSSRKSRVVPGKSQTSARFLPQSALSILDFPAFTAPAKATRTPCCIVFCAFMARKQ